MSSGVRPKATHIVSIAVQVTVNRRKFTKKFLESFRKSFYNFQDIEDHLRHLAWLYATGRTQNGAFIEGYGPAEEMGIVFKDCYNDTDDA